MHAIEVAIDDMCQVVERVFSIESEKFLGDIDLRIALSGDRLQQVQRAAEFLVKDGAGHVVSMLRVAIQKEAAAELVVRLIDRDVAARCLDVPDKQRRRRQSSKPAANNMRLHPPLPSSLMAGASPY